MLPLVETASTVLAPVPPALHQAPGGSAPAMEGSGCASDSKSWILCDSHQEVGFGCVTLCCRLIMLLGQMGSAAGRAKSGHLGQQVPICCRVNCRQPTVRFGSASCSSP